MEYVWKTGLLTNYGGVGEIDINPSVFHRDDRNKAMLDNPSTTYAVSITLTSEQFPSTRRAADTMLKNSSREIAPGPTHILEVTTQGSGNVSISADGSFTIIRNDPNV